MAGYTKVLWPVQWIKEHAGRGKHLVDYVPLSYCTSNLERHMALFFFSSPVPCPDPWGIRQQHSMHGSRVAYGASGLQVAGTAL